MNIIEKYAAPETVEQAVKLLSLQQAIVFAGSTDVMPLKNSGALEIKPLLMNIRRISDLIGIEDKDGLFRIGALTTVTQILDSGALNEKAKILPKASDCFASGQIRNSATLGGNICNASPAGDLIIPLILLDAKAELSSWVGNKIKVRKIDVCDLFVGPGKTKLKAGELLTSFVFKAPGNGFTASFEKFGVRPALDISIVSVGLAGIKDNGRLKNVRVAFGAVAPVPLRATKTEAVLEGREVDEEIIAKAVGAAMEEISPISDVRASAWYRREMIRTLFERLLRDVN